MFHEEIPQGEPITRLLVASFAPAKQSLITEAIQPLGIKTEIPDSSITFDEEEYKVLLREINTPERKYAARMSARKMQPFLSVIESGIPIMTLDTIVVDEDRKEVLEKPKTIEEARDMITRITLGNSIVHVSDGVTFGMKLRNGEQFYWRAAAVVALSLKEATQAKIDEYLKEMGDSILQVAGGIDFASPLGNDFINRQNNITFIVGREKAGQLDSLTGTLPSQSLPDSVYIAGDAERILSPYFKGVPIHLIQGVLSNFSPIK